MSRSNHGVDSDGLPLRVYLANNVPNLVRSSVGILYHTQELESQKVAFGQLSFEPSATAMRIRLVSSIPEFSTARLSIRSAVVFGQVAQPARASEMCRSHKPSISPSEQTRKQSPGS